MRQRSERASKRSAKESRSRVASRTCPSRVRIWWAASSCRQAIRSLSMRISAASTCSCWETCSSRASRCSVSACTCAPRDWTAASFAAVSWAQVRRSSSSPCSWAVFNSVRWPSLSASCPFRSVSCDWARSSSGSASRSCCSRFSMVLCRSCSCCEDLASASPNAICIWSRARRSSSSSDRVRRFPSTRRDCCARCSDELRSSSSQDCLSCSASAFHCCSLRRSCSHSSCKAWICCSSCTVCGAGPSDPSTAASSRWHTSFSR
mmetsp:Transcript_138342/g.240557  ORF Transcript_138342/g.240557 Transcript_138342/m.240557 type:complete len:263 (-) Transcript_138342:846-1634(-)